MTDWEAMEAIKSILERFYRGNLPHDVALLEIAEISGRNTIAHQEARP